VQLGTDTDCIAVRLVRNFAAGSINGTYIAYGANVRRIDSDIHVGGSSSVYVDSMRTVSRRRAGRSYVQVRSSGGANIRGRVRIDGWEITEQVRSSMDLDLDLDRGRLS
jgi:hypothetical protein